jgi:two-component system sensor histidine kinase RegB
LFFGVASAAQPNDASRLRLQTIVRLRWFAILGQSLAVAVVYFGLRFDLPLGFCLALIVLSAWLNVFLTIRHSARHRLGTRFATLLLAYDILQLAGLLYLTGGIENPFVILLVAPVTVSAATLQPRHTITLGVLALGTAIALTYVHNPLPWYGYAGLILPPLYKFGVLVALAACTVFLGVYAWRLSKEAREMSAALRATELVLAREQKLHAIDGLAAAAAHELGTPLSTIVLVAKELQATPSAATDLTADLALIQSQALRCREILQKLTRQPNEQDPLYASLSVTQMLDEAVTPHRGDRIKITVSAAPTTDPTTTAEPVAERRPGVIYGLGNLIENAVEFATTRADVTYRWTADVVTVEIADDGPGFPLDIIDSLGEPYVTTRPAGRPGTDAEMEPSGLGLGFFIAKTLLERSGATITLSNALAPDTGARVQITWPRSVFERLAERGPD